MAEGNWLPWKEQKVDIRPTPDYKELAKPLKKPPHGLEWQRLEDGTWELRSVGNAQNISEQQEEQQEEGEDKKGREGGPKEEEERAPEFLEHVVMPDDTLVGLCLKYKVKDRELRRLNGFVGSHFRMCDSLIIPNRFAAGQQPVQGPATKPPLTRDDKLQAFRKASQLGLQEARFYLETSDWDLPNALAEWREEHRWEAEQKANASSRQEDDQNHLPKLRRRRVADASSGGRGNFPVISGTSASTGATTSNLSVGNERNDGNIELSGIHVDGDGDDALAEARVPLLPNSYGSSSFPGVTFF